MPLLEVGYIRVTHPCATRHHVLLHVLPFDLHVLSLPLAFILSQDQTLRCIFVVCLELLPIPAWRHSRQKKTSQTPGIPRWSSNCPRFHESISFSFYVLLNGYQYIFIYCLSFLKTCMEYFQRTFVMLPDNCCFSESGCKGRKRFYSNKTFSQWI